MKGHLYELVTVIALALSALVLFLHKKGIIK